MAVLAGTRQSFEIEYPCHAPANQRWFFMRVTALNGKDHGVVVSHENITLRKQTEIELKKSYAKLEQVMRAGNVGLWDWNLLSNKVTYSAEWKRQIGYKEHELDNDFESWRQHLHPDDMEICLQRVQAFMENPQLGYKTEFRFRHKDGSYRWILAQAALEYDENGTPVRMQGSHIDLTERKKYEQQLQILSVAVEQSPAAIMILDADFNLLYVNPKFSEITGYQAEEVLRTPPRILHTSLNTAETYQQLWDTLNQGQIWHGELMNYRKNGELYWDEVHIAPVKNSQSDTNNYVGIKLDITQRKQTETELLLAKEAADKANQAKSEFLANMSHEIRTPLNAILGFSSILSELVVNSVQRHYLDAINRSGKTLLQLINDILDLSKIEAGKLELSYSPVEIASVFADIGMIFMQKMAEKDISFSVEIAENMPDYLLLDEIRLRQVLLNIVGNAVKFTEQGFIRISVTQRLAASSLALDLIIRIEDSGIGVAADQQAAIFSPFTQQKQQSVHYGGTGLGLTICKRLVEMMKGSITLHSELGVGSCFTLTFPQVEIYQQSPTASSLLMPLLSGKALHFQIANILVVDDIETNRLLIKAYLQDYPELNLIEAETGEQALSLIQQQPFDLILMDKRLPGEDGDTICQKIKTIPDYTDIPIIMVTASAIDQPAEQQPPYYDLQLLKPVKKTRLLTAIQNFLPLDKTMAIANTSLTTETAPLLIAEILPPEQQPEFVTLLQSRYQKPIAQLNSSGALRINTIIDIAEELLKIAEQYRCSVLSNWANTLKSQAELFELTLLAKTLSGFETLLRQLGTTSQTEKKEQ